MTTDKKPELAANLRCWCGSEVYAGRHKHMPGKFIVRCGSDGGNCRFFPSTGPITEKELPEAIAAWNRRYVCDDKNGKPVYAGDWFNFLSDRDPPVKLRFVWVQKTLRYMIENEEGSLYFPAPKDKIELVQETSENEKIEILEAFGWVYEESSDGTGAMFMYWEDPTKEMPEWCSDNTTSCECLDDVWQWYCEKGARP